MSSMSQEVAISFGGLLLADCGPAKLRKHVTKSAAFRVAISEIDVLTAYQSESVSELLSPSLIMIRIVESPVGELRRVIVAFVIAQRFSLIVKFVRFKTR